MTQYLPSPPLPVEADRRSSAPAPEHRWISRGCTLNPLPGPLLKQRRDTAEGCRDRATADLLEAVTMATAHSRQMLERSAASWNTRADLLQRLEAGMQVILQTNFGPRAVTIQKVGMSVVDVDLNHPMAGKDLRFAIEIVDVREASAEEVEHGHVHGEGGHHH